MKSKKLCECNELDKHLVSGRYLCLNCGLENEAEKIKLAEQAADKAWEKNRWFL